MTSSPAPDLDELERWLNDAVGVDFLPPMWRKVVESVPALLAELRAARAAVARVGELERAIRRFSDEWGGSEQSPDADARFNTAAYALFELAESATLPAPSDHGASGERNDWHHAAVIHDAAGARLFIDGSLVASKTSDRALLAAPSVPPEPASPEAK